VKYVEFLHRESRFGGEFVEKIEPGHVTGLGGPVNSPLDRTCHWRVASAGDFPALRWPPPDGVATGRWPVESHRPFRAFTGPGGSVSQTRVGLPHRPAWSVRFNFIFFSDRYIYI